MNRKHFQRGAFGRFLASQARTQSQQSLKSRKLCVEGLEERQLLSATPYETSLDLDQEFVADLQICGSPIADRGLETENIASLSDTINNLLQQRLAKLRLQPEQQPELYLHDLPRLRRKPIYRKLVDRRRGGRHAEVR